MYILFEDDKKIKEFKTISDCADYFKVSRQYICQSKRFTGCYQWKNFILAESNCWEAESYILWLRAKKYIDNPATAWSMYQALKKAFEKIDANVI